MISNIFLTLLNINDYSITFKFILASLTFKFNDYALLIISTGPPQTSFLLYKYRFEGVIFTRRNFPDAFEIQSYYSKNERNQPYIKPDYRKYFPDAGVQKLDVLQNSAH